MSSYPAEFSDETGAVRLNGSLDFTDPDNQPSTGLPFSVPETGTTPIITDVDDDALLSYDGDANTFEFGSDIAAPSRTITAQTINASAEIDAAGLGPTIPYVTVQAAAPTTYQTPIVVDTTAVTGATYAWDGAAYQKIADLLT